jgi:uncharacterized protein (DUF427 family)
VEATSRRIQVYFHRALIADTRRAVRVLETSHPPVYYLPPEDIQMQHLHPSPTRTYCEWKGPASYYRLEVAGQDVPDAAWTYLAPAPGFEAIHGYLAFYAQKMERCLVDGELVRPQPGRFYGGWITGDVVGPFKGEPGSLGW